MTVAGVSDFVTMNGRTTAMIVSGNEITLPFGQARIELLEGGEIILCAPAHLTVLKSGGAITLALDYGRVHAQIPSGVSLTIYTPLIVATPIPISQGLSDITIGLDQQDEMCALAQSGAARLAQQFSGQSLLVPQGGELTLTGGQLNAPLLGSEGCRCDLPVAYAAPSRRFALVAPLRPVTPAAGAAASARTLPAEPPSELLHGDLSMRVDMPPLTFDSASPTPPHDPDPATLLLVHETRVQSDVVFEGRVESFVAAAIPAPAAMQPPAASPARARKPGIFARLFGIFRQRKPCAGAGCMEEN